MDQILKDNEQKNNIIFVLGVLIFLLLVVSRNILNINISPFIFLIVYFVVAIFSSRSQIAALCVALIPFSAVFQFKYAILILMLVYVCKFMGDFKHNYSLAIFLVMLSWELFHGFVYPLNINELFRNFSEFLLCVFFLNINYKKFNYKLICRTLVWTSIGVMTILLYLVLKKTGFDFEKLFSGSNSSYRFGKLDSSEQYGGEFNPNSLGFVCNLSICSLLQIIYIKKASLIDYIGVALLIFFGVLTLSRSFLLCLVLIFVLLIYSRKVSFRMRIKQIFLFLLGFLLLIILVSLLFPTVIEGFTKRFQVDDISGGRIDLIIFYMKHVISSFRYLFFGIGLQNVLTKLNNIYSNVTLVPHNAIVEILLLWGLIGLILVVAFIISLVYYSKGRHKLSLLSCIPLVLILIYVQFGRLLIGGIPLLSFTFASFSIKCLRYPLNNTGVIKNEKDF